MSSFKSSQFSHRFLVVGSSALVLIVALLGYLFRNEEMSSLLNFAESKNVYLVQAFSNELLKDYYHQIEKLQKLSADELRQNLVARQFDKEIRAQIEKLDIHMISVVAPNGVTVLSTNPRTLGDKVVAPEIHTALNSVNPVSFLDYRDLVSSMESIKVHRYVVTSLIPLIPKGENVVVGLMVIKLDVTDYVNNINKKTTYSYVFIAIPLLILLAILFILVHKAGYKIKELQLEMEKMDKVVEHHLYHDTLTGLPNRIMFRERLEHEMKLCKLRNHLAALLFIDLDYFQKVNDALGYSVGDQLLMDAAARLQQCVRPGDTIARLGGDEFVVVLQSIKVMDEAEDIVRQILNVASEVYRVDDNELFMTMSVGVAMYPFTEDDANSLLKKANSAMKKAKQAGRNTFRYFTENTRKQLISRFSTENSLRRALERNEFKLYYQPIVQLRTGRIVSVEALLRWESPEQGFMLPDQFIPLLEESGLIIPVGQWVIENACHQGVQWNRDGIHDLKVNVNMSARQLLHRDLIKQVNDALDMTGLPPHLLDLEITESLLIEDFSNTIHILDNLNDIGISLSIDDFGTGYSSLSYLKRMPVDTLKIDRAFVRDIAVNIDDAAIVEAICALSRSLRFKVIAEGLESAAQLEHLRRAGVNQIQGFLLSKPVPASELEPLLRQKKILISSESAA